MVSRETDGAYFLRPTSVECFSTGCVLLDCVLGGKGWPLGRIVNVVGDKATGKTLLAIEAACNFAKQYPKGRIRYREVEAAFDREYAAALGLPTDRVIFPKDSCETVEELFNDLKAFVDRCDELKRPGLYIVDSLDALSSKAEMERAFGEASFGVEKAKDMSRLFRKLVRAVERSRVTVLIISQERDKIGVVFGKKSTRSGGRALDFYASHVLWLAQIKRLKKTRAGIARPVGVMVRAMCEKNKVGPPFRDCDFPILFGFGIDDVAAGLEWLALVKKAGRLGLKAAECKRLAGRLGELDGEEYRKLRLRMTKAVTRAWYEIEKDFAPRRSKY